MVAKVRHQELSFSESGGRVKVWRVDGLDIFFPERPIRVGNEDMVRGGLFACFPNFGIADPHFGLPQHGRLRHTEGVKAKYGGVETVQFAGPDLLGTCRTAASVRIDVTQLSGCSNGFVYGLAASVPPRARVPINPAFHPYFNTPRGSASFSLDGKRFRDVETLVNSERLPLVPRVTLTIPGVGIIEMLVYGDFLRSPKAYLNLWRDRTDYLCLEPVYAPPEYFGQPGGAYLDGSAGTALNLRCAFKVIG